MQTTNVEKSKNKISLGVSGIKGSFSEEAGLLYAKRAGIIVEIHYLTDMEGVLAAIAAEEIDLGIFPVVNTIGGLVIQAFAAMGNYLFTPIDELLLDVKQCLLTLPKTEMQQIKKIISHSQALAQCKNYIHQNFNKIELIEWIDTAKAAADLAAGLLSADSAVIAPKLSAKIYNLSVLAENIQDSKPNLTTFIIVTKHS